MGLVGENGAGKSTIINIIGGVHQRDEGHIVFEGKEVWFQKVQNSKKVGISIVHQEIQLIDNLSILENIFLGSEITNRFGLYDWRKMEKTTRVVLKKLDLAYHPRMLVEKLTIGEKQMVEIARALVLKTKLILFDEPTSAISTKETQKLFRIIRELKKDNISFVYISHRMEELKKICDRVTIIRDGNFIVEKELSKVSESQIVEHMIGRKLQDQYAKVSPRKGQVMLEVTSLTNKFLNNVSFKAYEGEILGFFGLVGARRTELFKSLIGLFKSEGEVKYHGQLARFKNPAQAIKNGLYYLTEDRKSEGLILDFPIKQNTSLSSLRSLFWGKLPIISMKREILEARKINLRLKTKMRTIHDLCQNLSGGNQQKVVLAKALMTMPKVLVLDEPTRGIDVGAKKEIYDLIQKLKTYNTCLIVISSDIQEVLGVSDRIAVMADGFLISQYQAQNATPSRIMNDIVSKTVRAQG